MGKMGVHTKKETGTPTEVAVVLIVKGPRVRLILWFISQLQIVCKCDERYANFESRPGLNGSVRECVFAVDVDVLHVRYHLVVVAQIHDTIKTYAWRCMNILNDNSTTRLASFLFGRDVNWLASSELFVLFCGDVICDVLVVVRAKNTLQYE